MLMRHRIRLPMHVQSAVALADLLLHLSHRVDGSAIVQSRVLAATADALRTRSLSDVFASLSAEIALESDPERRGALEGCAQAVRRMMD
jgi:hypothetical protein